MFPGNTRISPDYLSPLFSSSSTLCLNSAISIVAFSDRDSRRDKWVERIRVIIAKKIKETYRAKFDATWNPVIRAASVTREGNSADSIARATDGIHIPA